MSLYEALRSRGFVKQVSDEAQVQRGLDEGHVVYYAGFDPTADSLHVGSLMPIMAMAHMQRGGHFPIAIIGGGTTMIGDPSGKTESRRLMPREHIQANGVRILAQLQHYLQLDGTAGLFLDNADWLLDLRYIDFLREIGSKFKVNEMIKVEAYRQRLEREEGLSFLEFNYQLLQAYDFLVLFDRHHCLLQVGGDDQWGNILAGVDLIWRLRRKRAYGLTFPLIMTARGEKMGKTEAGTIWLDATKTSPFAFYQYWVNVDDRDVQRFLALFTFLPPEEIATLTAVAGAALREAKETLAFEVTKLAHGEAEARKAQDASRAAFHGGSGDATALPTTRMAAADIGTLSLIDLLCRTGLAASRSAARRLIEQGGTYVNGDQITAVDARVLQEWFRDGALLLRAGKKHVHRVLID